MHQMRFQRGRTFSALDVALVKKTPLNALKSVFSVKHADSAELDALTRFAVLPLRYNR